MAPANHPAKAQPAVRGLLTITFQESDSKGNSYHRFGGTHSQLSLRLACVQLPYFEVPRALLTAENPHIFSGAEVQRSR